MAALVQRIDIKVVGFGNGWQTIRLTFDDTAVGFLASYSGECPLSSLITLVANIDDDIQSGETSSRRHIEWFQEPGALQIIVNNDNGIDEIIIKKTFKDVMDIDFTVEEIENPDELYHFQVQRETLRNAVIAEATSMLKEFGIAGYNENWNDGPDNFPVAAFLRLLGNKTTSDEEGDIYFSRLDEEINLLKSIL